MSTTSIETSTEPNTESPPEEAIEGEPLEATVGTSSAPTSNADGTLTKNVIAYQAGAGSVPPLNPDGSIPENVIVWWATGQSPSAIGNSQHSGNYAFVAADNKTVVESTGATAANFTMPAGLIPFDPADNAVIEVYQAGAGQVTFVAGSGVTFQSLTNLVRTAGVGATVRLRQRAQDIWVLSGDLA